MDRDEVLALYEKLVATNPAVERKGDTMPYTSLNGHMFSVLHKDGTVALRLPESELATFLSKYSTKQPLQYGVVLKEYAVVPETLLRRTKELARWFETSRAYVASLKPKPTTRAKKSASSAKSAKAPKKK